VIRASAILLFSNTGFDADAIRRAKQVKVGLISALKQGDQRIKGQIEEEIYLRTVNISPFTIDYEGATKKDFKVLRQYLKVTHDVTYAGGSVAAWLQQRAAVITAGNPMVDKPLVARFDFKVATKFLVQRQEVTLRSISIHFRPQVRWSSQTVALDAKTGIYDYVRGRVRLAGGPNTYVINGVNFDTAVPMIRIVMIEGLDLPPGLQVANLDDLVKPEDLSLAITAGTPPVR
jgi:hypothetical protein